MRIEAHSAGDREEERYRTALRVATEVPATGEAGQLLGDAALAGGQVEGHVTIARTADDFNMFPDKSKQVQRNFSLAEVQRCGGLDGGCLYVVCDGAVLDLTKFAPHHPAGPGMLQKYGGKDASAAMHAAGMPAAVFDHFLKRFVVGRLVNTESY